MNVLKKWRKRILIILLFVILVTVNTNSYAWGPKGHAIVAQIAWRYLSAAARQKLEGYFGGITIDSAGNWMDAMRANAAYDFMKPWHYINFEKGGSYIPSIEDNIVNRLTLTFNELKHKPLLCDDQIKFDLLILFHLIGDLHQPLHVGYGGDKGGNTKQVEFLSIKTNLHHVWDENIIDAENITLDQCLALADDLPTEQLKLTQSINFVNWMNESRSLLDTAYDLRGFILDRDYADKSAVIVKRRLFYAGIRLAAALEKIFVEPSPVINTDSLAANYKKGIPIDDAMKYIGKKVTVCSRVYGVKTTEKVTFINLGHGFRIAL